MLRLGLRLSVLLAAILTLLALSTGHDASASPVVQNGPWAAVFSTNTQVNAGDCQGSITGPDAALVDGGGLWNCETGGAPVGTNGALSAALTGSSISGSIVFTGPGAGGTVTFTGAVSSPGSSFPGTYIGPAGPGTYRAALQQTTGSPGQTVIFPIGGGAAATLTGAVGNTAIITAPTAGGPLPPQFQLVGQYYHVITTDPGTNAPYIFCAGYPDADNNGYVDTTGTDETTLVIGHYDPPNGTNGWVFQRYEVPNGPPPPYSDTAANTVCASVNHLSEFALVTTTPSVGGLVSIVNGDSSSGINIWLWAAAITGSATVLVTGAWIGKRRRRLD